MKRLSYIYILLSLAVALVLNVSCEKDIQDVTSCEGLKICAEIVNYQVASKVGITDVTDYGLKLTWNSDKSDKIFGYWTSDGGTTKNTIILNVDELSNGNTRAVFKLADGGGALPTGTATFYLICAPAIPQGVTGGSEWSDIQISLGVQTGELANLKDYAYLCATGTPVIKGNGATLDLKFTNQYSVLSITKLRDIAAGGNYITFSADGLSSSGTIGINSANGNTFEFIPKVSPTDADKVIKLTNAISSVSSSAPLYVLVPSGSQGLTLSNINISLYASSDAGKALTQKSLGSHPIAQSICYQMPEISFKEIRWLTGVFTVSDGSNTRKVQFAAGNLFRENMIYFTEDNQYDYHLYSIDESGNFESSQTQAGFFSTKKDVINSIKSAFPEFSVLDKNEWQSLMNYNNDASTKRYGMAVITTPDNKKVNGFVLLPDGVTVTGFNPISSKHNFTDNKLTTDQWQQDYEQSGAVFLPAVYYALSQKYDDGTTGQISLYLTNSTNANNRYTSAHWTGWKSDFIESDDSYRVPIRIVREVND